MALALCLPVPEACENASGIGDGYSELIPGFCLPRDQVSLFYFLLRALPP